MKPRGHPRKESTCHPRKKTGQISNGARCHAPTKMFGRVLTRPYVVSHEVVLFWSCALLHPKHTCHMRSKAIGLPSPKHVSYQKHTVLEPGTALLAWTVEFSGQVVSRFHRSVSDGKTSWERRKQKATAKRFVPSKRLRWSTRWAILPSRNEFEDIDSKFLDAGWEDRLLCEEDHPKFELQERVTFGQQKAQPDDRVLRGDASLL